MIEFNHTYLANLILMGFKYILYFPDEDHSLLLPSKDEIPVIIMQAMNGYQIKISESEIFEMASGDEFGFKFYISESFQSN